MNPHQSKRGLKHAVAREAMGKKERRNQEGQKDITPEEGLGKG